MTDEFEPSFSGLDGERPLPPAVRERLEAALLAAAAGEAPPVSAEETAAPVAESPLPLDGPRPLPPDLRSRLEGALLGRRTGARTHPPFVPALLAVAALVLLVGSVGLIRGIGTRSGGGREVTAAGPTGSTVRNPESTRAPGSPESPAAPAAGDSHEITSTSTAPADRLGPRSARPSGPSAAVNPPGGPGGSAGRDPGAPANSTPTAPSPAAGDSGNGTSPTEPGTPGNGEARNATGPGGGDPGPPPPYAFSAAPAATSTADSSPGQASAQPGRSGSAEPAPTAPQPSASASPPASSGGPAFRLGLVGGDPAQEAGFRAYIDLLNRRGGVRGLPVELVPTGPESPAAGTLATVNLSSRPVASTGGAPKWAGGGPVLETLTATEDLLTGRVFSFASPPERQGHLVADAVFPEPAPGATAVIYRALDGPLAGAVPRAMEAVLTKRGVRVVNVAYDPAKPPPLVPADAAFLSLDTATARTWLGQARQTGYSTRRGVAGIYSLFDPSVLPDLPEGARVVSPYVVPAGDEGEAIRSGAGVPSAAVLHGWATAKSLAVALWRSGAGTPDAMQAAIEGLAGYDSGLAPPYETRPNTRSRTPEGVLYEARSGAFTIQGGFRRDPH